MKGGRVRQCGTKKADGETPSLSGGQAREERPRAGSVPKEQGKKKDDRMKGSEKRGEIKRGGYKRLVKKVGGLWRG